MANGNQVPLSEDESQANPGDATPQADNISGDIETHVVGTDLQDMPSDDDDDGIAVVLPPLQVV